MRKILNILAKTIVAIRRKNCKLSESHAVIDSVNP